MIRTFIIAAVAAAVITPVAANAGNSHRQKHHSYHRAQMWNAPVAMRRPVGPPWAGPNQCFTDEGYGRYASCDGRR